MPLPARVSAACRQGPGWAVRDYRTRAGVWHRPAPRWLIRTDTDSASSGGPCGDVTFDAGMLWWIAWLDKRQLDTAPVRPSLQVLADKRQPVIAVPTIRLATPFDDPIQRPEHAGGGQREVGFNTSPSRQKSSSTLNSRKLRTSVS